VTGLAERYRRTTYRVTGVTPPIDIRIDQSSPALDLLLEKHGARRWAFVTAWNPGSKKLNDAENQRRQQQLEADVKEGGYVFYRGAGVPDEKGWQAEESMLILGVERDDAIRLGKKYEQAAVVLGLYGESGELFFI
jgi:hypothetical protein